MMWTSPVLPWFDRVAQDKGVPGAVVIRENASDPIAVRGRAVAASIASAVTSAKLDDVIPAADSKQRVLIATHELIWMLLDRANRDLPVVPPPALKAGARTIEEVAPLVVVIERAGTP